MKNTPETDSIWSDIPFFDPKLPAHARKLEIERDEALEKLADVLSDTTYYIRKEQLVEKDEQIAVLREALSRIHACTDSPDIDVGGEMQIGLHCGVEDRGCRDRYDGADVGWAQGVERTLEWAQNEAAFALNASKPPAVVLLEDVMSLVKSMCRLLQLANVQPSGPFWMGNEIPSNAGKALADFIAKYSL